MCPLNPLHQNLSDFWERKRSPVANIPFPHPTILQKASLSIVKGGLMDCYLELLRYHICIWCNENFGWYKYGLERLKYTRNTF
jgi:hypothetical protein